MRKLTLIIAFILLTAFIHAANGAEVGPDAHDTSEIAEVAIQYYTEFGRTPTNKELNEMIFYYNLMRRFRDFNARCISYAFPQATPITTKTEDELPFDDQKRIWTQFDYAYREACDFLQEASECNCEACFRKQIVVATAESVVYTTALSKEYFPQVKIVSVIKRMNDLYGSSGKPQYSEHGNKTPKDMGYFAVDKTPSYDF